MRFTINNRDDYNTHNHAWLKFLKYALFQAWEWSCHKKKSGLGQNVWKIRLNVQKVFKTRLKMNKIM